MARSSFTRDVPPFGDRASSGGSGPTPPASVDHFEATIIIGNVPNGDPAVAQAAPFEYLPDPGDGTAIQAALAQALATGVRTRIRLRPGTYTLDPNLIPSLAIPSWVVVEGAYGAMSSGSFQPVRIERAFGDPWRTVFDVEGGLRHVQISLAGPAEGVTPIGESMILVRDDALVQDVSAMVTADDLTQDDDSLLAMFYAGGIGGRILDCWAQYDPEPTDNSAQPRVAAYMIGDVMSGPVTRSTIVRGVTGAAHLGTQIRINAAAQDVHVDIQGGAVATGRINGSHVQARLSTAAITDSLITPPYQLELGGARVILDYMLRDTGADMQGYIDCTGSQVTARVSCEGTVSSGGIVDSGTENQWTGYVDGAFRIDGTLIGFSNGRVTDTLTINGDNNNVIGSRIANLVQNSVTSNAASNIVGV